MKSFDELMGELRRISIDSPIVHQCFEMQRVNDMPNSVVLAVMALTLAQALKGRSWEIKQLKERIRILDDNARSDASNTARVYRVHRAGTDEGFGGIKMTDQEKVAQLQKELADCRRYAELLRAQIMQMARIAEAAWIDYHAEMKIEFP